MSALYGALALRRAELGAAEQPQSTRVRAAPVPHVDIRTPRPRPLPPCKLQLPPTNGTSALLRAHSVSAASRAYLTLLPQTDAPAFFLSSVDFPHTP